jgi:hypothetical protein
MKLPEVEQNLREWQEVAEALIMRSGAVRNAPLGLLNRAGFSLCHRTLTYFLQT